MKILSGGQTGVDRAALDFAIQHGIDHGGWCPRGRPAEDGPIPSRYHLQETESPDYNNRTERNVLDSDATLIIARDEPLMGGTAFTHELAVKHRRPVLVIYESGGLEISTTKIKQFLKQHVVQTLNVAGPRESEAASLATFIKTLLRNSLPPDT